MTVKYKSTRGVENNLSFEQVVLNGLAIDKGLYVPETIPQLSMSQIEKMRKLTYSELAFEIISLYVHKEDIPANDLKNIVNKSFSSFRTPEVTPSIKLEDFWVLELFHGPTFAFKDVALQFLGNIFEYFLTRGNIQKSITILGATSGDTGSAAIHGLRGKANVNCFIMFPIGKVTEIQERQMTTIPDGNVHCIGIDGDFDDAQAIVKAAFADESFRTNVKLGAINSINWARVLAQITYYFYSYLRVTDNVKERNLMLKTPKVSYAVPTGNFGDILAGFYAKRMGLPVDKLIVCTNQNDVLHRFFETGCYSKESAVLTIAPSMDISVSSNFERYLYYLANQDGELLAKWMNQFETTGILKLPNDLITIAKSEFLSFATNKDLIIKTMQDLYLKENYLVCPHTATAVAAIQSALMNKTTNVLNNSIPVCLATAHAAKFEEAMTLALENTGRSLPSRPEVLEKLFQLPTRRIDLPNSLSAIQTFMYQKLKKSEKKDDSYTMIAWCSLATVTIVTAFIAFRYIKQSK